MYEDARVTTARDAIRAGIESNDWVADRFEDERYVDAVAALAAQRVRRRDLLVSLGADA
jgi:hypothetical protein